VLQDHSKSLDLTQPRRVPEVLSSALWLYLTWPALFVALSAIVVVPYELVVQVVAHASPLGQQNSSAGTLFILEVIDLALVAPFISALAVQAVITIGDGQTPEIGDVIRRGVRVLPVVAAAEIIVGIGVAIGLAFLIIPGVILALRWAVVAQVAAVERTDWPTALRRGAQLARRNYLRIFALLIVIALVNVTLTGIGGAIAGTRDGAVQVVVGIIIVVLTRTFGALVTAVLYFDLRAREAESGGLY
jgi:hypothetical protein